MDTLKAVDAIYAGFIEALLFSSTATAADGSEIDDDLRRHFSESDLDPDSRASARAFCESFYAHCHGLVIAESGATWDKAGADLWFTLAGHGCGFWDGGWPRSGTGLCEWCDLYPNADAGIGINVDENGRLVVDGIPTTSTDSEG